MAGAESPALASLGGRGDLDEMIDVGLLGTPLGRTAASPGWSPDMVAAARVVCDLQ